MPDILRKLPACGLTLALAVCAAAQTPLNARIEPRPDTWPPVAASETKRTVPSQAHVEPEQAPKHPGTVSLQDLTHPPSEKGLKLLLKARQQILKSEHEAAEKTLTAALEEEGTRPYVMALQGGEHLAKFLRERGQDPALLETAIAELDEAVRSLPGDPASHANLGYALYMAGDDKRALPVARRAVQLSPGSPKSRYVLGRVLLADGQESDALFHLRLAAVELDLARDLVEEIEARTQNRR